MERIRGLDRRDLKFAAVVEVNWRTPQPYDDFFGLQIPHDHCSTSRTSEEQRWDVFQTSHFTERKDMFLKLVPDNSYDFETAIKCR